MLVASPLDGGLLAEVGVGDEVVASLTRVFVVFSTPTEARTQTEVVDAESDCRKQ